MRGVRDFWHDRYAVMIRHTCVTAYLYTSQQCVNEIFSHCFIYVEYTHLRPRCLDLRPRPPWALRGSSSQISIRPIGGMNHRQTRRKAPRCTRALVTSRTHVIWDISTIVHYLNANIWLHQRVSDKRKREREGKREGEKGPLGERFHDMRTWLCHQTEPTNGIDLAFTAAWSILQPEQARSTSAANLKRAGSPRKGSSSLTMRGATLRVPFRLAKSLCLRETPRQLDEVSATSLWPVDFFSRWAHD